MVAAVGAVVLARRRRGLEAEEDEYEHGIVAEHRPIYTGTQAETTGVRRHAALEAEAEAAPAGSTSGSEGGW
jgi:hypothetical protein